MTHKTVLIITSYRSKVINWADREKYVEEFYQNLEESLEKVKVVYTTYNDIVTSVINNRVQMIDVRHNVPLDKVDLVHFKNWMFDNEHASLIAFYLKTHRINFYNEEVDAGLAYGKISQMCRLAIGGVPVPDSIFAKKSLLRSCFAENTLPKPFDYPLILKADDGAKGNDNHLVKNSEEAVAVLDAAAEDKEFIVQNFIPNEGDYRYLFAGIDLDPLVFTRTAQEGTHLNNTSQGGKGSFIDPSTMPKSHLDYAREAARILRREISGVDIIVNKDTGKPYVLEVNSTPALATGYGVDKKIILFKNFINSQLSEQEEE